MQNNNLNKLTQDEELLIQRLTDSLRQHSENQKIRSMVEAKMATTKFSMPGKTPLPKTAIISILSFLAVSTVLITTIIYLSKFQQDDIEPSDAEQKFSQVEQPDDPTFRKDSFNFQSQLDNPPNIKKSPKRQRSDADNKTALPGLPPVSSKRTDAIVHNTDSQVFSFYDSYSFDARADLKKLKADLIKELKHINYSVLDKSNKSELIYLTTAKKSTVNSSGEPVDYYIVIQVEKRFTGNLKVFLRYSLNSNENTTNQSETVDNIFYQQLKSRISNLIHWKYKPHE